MVDWGRVLSTTGEVLRGISDASIINNWLEMDDQDAFAGIVSQVKTASTADVDRLDSALLSMASTSFDTDKRRRLIKFYAIFKIAELERYQEFRGFP